MIIWLASYPRSGNTFLRMVIHRLYGRGSSAVYPVDGVLDRLGGELVVTADAGSSLAELRESPEVHFVKTHRRRDYDVVDADRSVYLVRDGRDAAVSFARQRAEDAPDRFRDELRALLDRHTGGTASWGQNVLSWLPAEEPTAASGEVLVRFDDLTRDPVATVVDAVGQIAPDLPVRAGARVPTFDQLHRVDPAFFRRGRVGSHREELPTDLEELFWSYPDNRDAMDRLGYR